MYSSTVMYVRVSSTKQDTLSQKPELRRWLEKENIKAQWYEDVGTGKTMTRAGIQRVIAGVKCGEIKARRKNNLSKSGLPFSTSYPIVGQCMMP